MPENTNTTEYNYERIANWLFGRAKIYTSVTDLTEENVINEVNTAIGFHVKNLMEEEYLYWYRRGIMPILWRKKEIRPEICAKIGVNYADQIVSFKDGYFLAKPAFYVSRTDDEEKTEKIKELNEYLYRSGKQEADNDVVDWFHTVGLGVIHVMPNDDEEVPAVVYSLDPRTAFVVYSLNSGNKPVYAVHLVTDNDKVMIDVITKTQIFHLFGTVTGTITTYDPLEYTVTASGVTSVEPNRLGLINIIEYQYNSVRAAAFESVVPLIDAVNLATSDRSDGLEQIIQSLLVFYNCNIEDDDDGNPITPEAIRKAGALFLKSIGENKADLKEISTNLDQSQSQQFIDDLERKIFAICGMPTSNGGRTYDSTGSAALANNGWYQAETVASNTKDNFVKSNKYFDEVFLKILKVKKGFEISPNDFDIKIPGNETANIQSKAQACQTMLAAGLAPELAFTKSGISNDPVADVEMSKKYLALIWGDPDKPEEISRSVDIVEEDNNNGENAIGGAV